MKLPLVYGALLELPHDLSGDQTQLSVLCPFCGGGESHERKFSIKVDIEDGEPMLYRCWRASCGETGILNNDTLQLLGITDVEVISELSAYNKSLKNGSNYKDFVSRKKKEYESVNLATKDNRAKLDYINHRLGQRLNFGDLRSLKIQLSLYDMLNINSIHKLAFSKQRCDLLDEYTVGFISVYSDYLICRDITEDLTTGMRYTNYRISGKSDPNDMKLYVLPTEIDLLDPHSAIINVAEGPFSILGAYLNTNLGRDRRNTIWMANCGSDYRNNILHICKQYGLLKVRINIWSDSEIKLDKYRKLKAQLRDHLDIRKFTVYYNQAAEDFGHAARDIKIMKSEI